MSELAVALDQFNRKERFWLLKEALGLQPLTQQFRTKLNAVFGSDAQVAIPENAWWAIDYHVDWLFGALSLSVESEERFPAHINAPIQVTGTQEDFDLVIAYDHTLIVVEAKAGSNWDKKQLRSKLSRLAAVCEFNSRFVVPVRILFVLASPRPPGQLDISSVPTSLLSEEGSLYWIPLTYGTPNLKHLAVTRCDLQGKRIATSDHWRVREV